MRCVLCSILSLVASPQLSPGSDLGIASLAHWPVSVKGHSAIRENLEAPNLIEVNSANPVERATNFAMLEQLRLLKRRVRIQFRPEVYVKWGCKPWHYKRLLKVGVVASCPSPEQAMALLDAVQAVVKQFNGKWLQEKPLEISSASAPDPQVK